MFSIVIPTYKRDEDLDECLKSIRENSTDKNIEVIVLHGGFDSTAAVCEKYGALSVLDHARENGKRVKSLWAIINDGIKMAKSQYVLYLNDDCLVMPGWDTICAKYFEDKKTGLLVCRSKGIGNDPFFQIIRTFFFDFPCANYAILNKNTGVLFDEHYNWYCGDADYPLELAYRSDYKIAESREDLIIHNHKIDDSRLEHDSSPHVRLDENYHFKKWAYFKRMGNRVVKMSPLEKMMKIGKTCLKAILRPSYHFAKKITKNTRVFLIYLRDMIRYPFEKRITYNVYGYSAAKDYIKNYMFLDFFPISRENFVLSTFHPKIQFFEPSSDNIKRIKSKTKQMKVFITGECLHSAVVSSSKLYEGNMIDDVDISLGFDYISADNYVRYPYWLWTHFSPTKDKNEIKTRVDMFNSRSFEKTKFCALISSHDRTGIRRNMLNQIISNGMYVDSAGRFAHNDDSLTTEFFDSKEKYLQQYKFNLCPENDAYEGYVTEKIFDSLWSGCIPVYYGGEKTPEPLVINENAYIFFDPENPKIALEKIKELASDNDVYSRFILAPKLKESATDYIYETMKRTYELFSKVFYRYFPDFKEK